MISLSRIDRESLVASTIYPGLPGKEVSRITGIKQSSLLRSRKKLMEAGVIRHIRVPAFTRVGFSIFFSGFGVLQDSGKERPSHNIPGIFLLSSEGNKGFGMGVSRTYEDFYRTYMDFQERYSWLEAEKFGTQVFPLFLSRIWRFADFGPMLAKDLSVEIPMERDAMGIPSSDEPYSFSRSEFEVYRELIKHPDWSVEKMANHLGTSRQRIYRLDRHFRDEGLYYDRMIPDLRALGYELLMFSCFKIPPGEKDMVYGLIGEKDVPWAFQMITTSMEGVLLGAFRTFREGKKISSMFEEVSQKVDMQRYSPNIIFMSLQDMVDTAYYDFSGIFR